MTSAHQLLDDLIALSHFLGDPANDFAILGEGNTSARIDDDTFYVKASGRHLGSITRDGFCRVRFDRILPVFDAPDPDDAAVKRILLECREEDAGGVMPSVETFFHAYLLTLPGVSFVGHTHPTAVNSLLCSRDVDAALAGRLFPDEIVNCGVAPCFVEYTDPGAVLSKLIKRRVEEFAEAHNEWPKTILMQNHGLIAAGRSADDVRAITAMYVKTARVLLGAAAFGGPHFLSPENVRRIHTRPDEHYRRKQLGQG